MQFGNVIASVELATAITAMILDYTNKYHAENMENQRRGSLVAKLAEEMFHAIQRDGHKLGIVIFRTTLKHQMEFRDGGWVGTAEIGGWGYSIYAIYWGWIRNDDERGFENWCVCGYQRQFDNVINIDQ
jgi:hypothetical protein